MIAITRDELKDMARGLLYMPTDWPEDRNYFLQLSSKLLLLLEEPGDFVIYAPKD